MLWILWISTPKPCAAWAAGCEKRCGQAAAFLWAAVDGRAVFYHFAAGRGNSCRDGDARGRRAALFGSFGAKGRAFGRRVAAFSTCSTACERKGCGKRQRRRSGASSQVLARGAGKRPRTGYPQPRAFWGRAPNGDETSSIRALSPDSPAAKRRPFCSRPAPPSPRRRGCCSAPWCPCGG